MDTYTPALASHFTQLLSARETELREVLRTGESLAETEHELQRGVTDFKELATEETQAAVDDVQLQHAAEELEQVLGALRRLSSGSYGVCLDCGGAVDLRRLTALPATPYCTACQSTHERPRH